METRDHLEAAPPPPQKHGWMNWFYEIVALAFSTAALASVAVLLATQDGSLVTDWDFPLSINTIVAILGVLNKATLAFVISACIGQHKWNMFKREGGKLALFEQFDEASRGPWGGLGLMFRTRGLNWANLGALVMILSLAVDPFLQEAVKLVGKTSPVDDGGAVPSLPDGQSFDVGRLIETFPPGVIEIDGLAEDWFRQELDFGITAAINDGFGRSVRTSNTDPKVPFQCSANCTWPAYTTASVCSKCNDVTSSLSKRQADGCTKLNGTDQNVNANTDMVAPCTTFSAANYGRLRQFDGYLLDQGMQLADVLTPGQAQFKVLMTANISMDYTQTVTFKDTETMFMSYLVMKVSDDFFRNETTWEDSSPSAEECGLYFCAKAYETEVKNGVLTEKQVGMWAEKDPQSWRLLNDDSSDDAEEFMDEHPSLGQTSHLRTDLVMTVPDGEVEGEVATRFSVTQGTIRGLQDSLKDLTMYTTTERTGEDGAIITEVARPLVFPPSGDAKFDFPLGELFWNSTNLTVQFDRLSNRLSVELRSSLPDKLSGTLHLYRIHIHVQWRFLTLPLLALLVGWVYFAIVTIQTRRLGIPVMKEGILPTLTHGLDESTREYLKTLQDEPKSGIKHMNNLRLGLRHGEDGGLQLGMTGDSPSYERKGRSKTGMDPPDVAEPFPSSEEDGQHIGMLQPRHAKSAQ